MYLLLGLSVIQKKKKENQELEAEELQFLAVNAGQSCTLYKVSVGLEQQEGEVQIYRCICSLPAGPGSQARQGEPCPWGLLLEARA